MILAVIGSAMAFFMALLLKFELLHIKIRISGFHHRCIGSWYVCKARIQRHWHLGLIGLAVFCAVCAIVIATAYSEANKQMEAAETIILRQSDDVTNDEITNELKLQNHFDNCSAGNDLRSIFSENGFIFQNSSYALLATTDIENLRARENSDITFGDMLQYAINEIYARHGRRFTAAEYNNFYTKYEWYTPTVNEVYWEEFNEFEKNNITLLLNVQKECGYRKP